MTYRSIKSILAAGLDRQPIDEPVVLHLPSTHAHVRGAAYYGAAIPAIPAIPLDLFPQTLTGDSSC